MLARCPAIEDEIVLHHLRQSSAESARRVAGDRITSSNVRRGTIDSTARRLVPNRRVNGIGATPPRYRLSRAASNTSGSAAGRRGGSGQLRPGGLDAVDERQDTRQINALRIRHAGAIAVGDVRVHGEHDVRAAEHVGTAGIAEAHAAGALRRIRRQLDEFVARGVVALNELARREEADGREDLLRWSAAATNPCTP